MGITNFQIVLDSPTGAYYAGQNVTGKLLLSLDKPKKIRGMMAKYCCYHLQGKNITAQ